MLRNNIQSTDSVLQADIIALDSLFKRIAERGRKIRLRKTSTDGEGSDKNMLPAGQDLDPQDKEKTKRVETVEQKRGNK